MLIQIHKNKKLIKHSLGGRVQKCVWPVRSLDSKIDCISKMYRWSKLIFLRAGGINSGKLKVDSITFG